MLQWFRDRSAKRYIDGKTSSCDRNALIRVLKNGVCIDRIQFLSEVIKDRELLLSIEDYRFAEDNEKKTIMVQAPTIGSFDIAELVFARDSPLFKSMRKLVDSHVAIDVLESDFSLIEKYLEIFNGGQILAHGSNILIMKSIQYLKKKSIVLICKCACSSSRVCSEVIDLVINYEIPVSGDFCLRYYINYSYPVMEESIEDNCNICFEPCTNKLSCGHTFHQECINNWDIQNKKCSMCSYPIFRYAFSKIEKTIEEMEDQIVNILKEFLTLALSNH